MRVIASEAAAERIASDVYVWLKAGRCCGAVTMLETSTVAPADKVSSPMDADAPFDLYATSFSRLPDELHVDRRGRSRRLRAYWNGCAWVV